MKPINKVFLLLLFQFTLQIHFATAQDIPFVPPVFNYNTSNYTAGNQNWAISQDNNEVMYFANNQGLLSFDGVNWILHKLPNNRGVKSIFINNQDNRNKERIYVGSFEEFGYFERNNSNILIYHSLKHLVSDYTFMNDEIWTILEYNNKVYFQSFSSYFTYSNNTVTAHKSNPSPLFFFTLQNKLFAQFIENGLYQLKDENFERVIAREQLADDDVVGMISLENDNLIVTSKNGFFILNSDKNSVNRWKTSIDNELQEAVINRVVTISDSLFVMGTINNGIYAITNKGKLAWHINRKNGLNNNTVLGLYKDKTGNLWAALDNGISNIQLQYDISIFEPSDIQIGMVEDMLITDDKTYVATNQGVYLYNPTIESFTQLPEFNIQTWYIKEIDNQIIAGHNQGASFIKNNEQTLIKGSSIGGTDIKEVNINGKDALIETTYSFLSVFIKDNAGTWQFSHNITDGFVDLATNLEVDHTGNLWLNHMYKGIYRLRLDNEIKKVVEKEYFDRLDSLSTPSPLNVMKLRGRVVLSDGKGFYTYDDILQKIIPYTQLNSQLPMLAETNRIVTVNDQLFWFIKNNEYVLVEYNVGSYKIKDKVPFSIFNNPPNQGRSNIYIDNNESSYFCLNGGIAKYNFIEKNDGESKDLLLQSVWSYNRKENTYSYHPLDEQNVFEFNENTIGFSFAYPDFSKRTFKVECFLENYDTRWMPTNNQLSITYGNLPADNYTLKARIVNDLGEETAQLSFRFEIKHPWYQTSWAYILYTALAMLIAGSLTTLYIRYAIRRNTKTFEEQEQKRLVQLNKQEKQIATLKSERLQADLSHKSKELASATILIINHEEFLNDLKKDIQQNALSGKIQKKQSEQLIDKINQNLSEEDEWSVFQENFDLIHKNFFRNLKTTYPDLTPADLRLCALLRLNYTTKEIARMQNLSLRGVEAARYRLRKKIDIQENEDLVSFMINFS